MSSAQEHRELMLKLAILREAVNQAYQQVYQEVVSQGGSKGLADQLASQAAAAAYTAALEAGQQLLQTLQQQTHQLRQEAEKQLGTLLEWLRQQVEANYQLMVGGVESAYSEWKSYIEGKRSELLSKLDEAIRSARQKIEAEAEAAKRVIDMQLEGVTGSIEADIDGDGQPETYESPDQLRSALHARVDEWKSSALAEVEKWAESKRAEIESWYSTSLEKLEEWKKEQMKKIEEWYEQALQSISSLTVCQEEGQEGCVTEEELESLMTQIEATRILLTKGVEAAYEWLVNKVESVYAELKAKIEEQASALLEQVEQTYASEKAKVEQTYANLQNSITVLVDTDGDGQPDKEMTLDEWRAEMKSMIESEYQRQLEQVKSTYISLLMQGADKVLVDTDGDGTYDREMTVDEWYSWAVSLLDQWKSQALQEVETEYSNIRASAKVQVDTDGDGQPDKEMTLDEWRGWALSQLDQWYQNAKQEVENWKQQALAELEQWRSETLNSLRQWRDEVKAKAEQWRSETLSELEKALRSEIARAYREAVAGLRDWLTRIEAPNVAQEIAGRVVDLVRPHVKRMVSLEKLALFANRLLQAYTRVISQSPERGPELARSAAEAVKAKAVELGLSPEEAEGLAQRVSAALAHYAETVKSVRAFTGALSGLYQGYVEEALETGDPRVVERFRREALRLAGDLGVPREEAERIVNTYAAELMKYVQSADFVRELEKLYEAYARELRGVYDAIRAGRPDAYSRLEGKIEEFKQHAMELAKRMGVPEDVAKQMVDLYASALTEYRERLSEVHQALSAAELEIAKTAYDIARLAVTQRQGLGQAKEELARRLDEILAKYKGKLPDKTLEALKRYAENRLVAEYVNAAQSLQPAVLVCTKEGQGYRCDVYEQNMLYKVGEVYVSSLDDPAQLYSKVVRLGVRPGEIYTAESGEEAEAIVDSLYRERNPGGLVQRLLWRGLTWQGPLTPENIYKQAVEFVEGAASIFAVPAEHYERRGAEAAARGDVLGALGGYAAAAALGTLAGVTQFVLGFWDVPGMARFVRSAVTGELGGWIAEAPVSRVAQLVGALVGGKATLRIASRVSGKLGASVAEAASRVGRAVSERLPSAVKTALSSLSARLEAARPALSGIASRLAGRGLLEDVVASVSARLSAAAREALNIGRSVLRGAAELRPRLGEVMSRLSPGEAVQVAGLLGLERLAALLREGVGATVKAAVTDTVRSLARMADDLARELRRSLDLGRLTPEAARLAVRLANELERLRRTSPAEYAAAVREVQARLARASLEHRVGRAVETGLEALYAAAFAAGAAEALRERTGLDVVPVVVALSAVAGKRRGRQLRAETVREAAKAGETGGAREAVTSLDRAVELILEGKAEPYIRIRGHEYALVRVRTPKGTIYRLLPREVVEEALRSESGIRALERYVGGRVLSVKRGGTGPIEVYARETTGRLSPLDVAVNRAITEGLVRRAMSELMTELKSRTVDVDLTARINLLKERIRQLVEGYRELRARMRETGYSPDIARMAEALRSEVLEKLRVLRRLSRSEYESLLAELREASGRAGEVRAEYAAEGVAELLRLAEADRLRAEILDLARRYHELRLRARSGDVGALTELARVRAEIGARMRELLRLDPRLAREVAYEVWRIGTEMGVRGARPPTVEGLAEFLRGAEELRRVREVRKGRPRVPSLEGVARLFEWAEEVRRSAEAERGGALPSPASGPQRPTSPERLARPARPSLVEALERVGLRGYTVVFDRAAGRLVVEVGPGRGAEAARALAEALREAGRRVRVEGTRVVDESTGRVAVEVREAAPGPAAAVVVWRGGAGAHAVSAALRALHRAGLARVAVVRGEAPHPVVEVPAWAARRILREVVGELERRGYRPVAVGGRVVDAATGRTLLEVRVLTGPSELPVRAGGRPVTRLREILRALEERGYRPVAVVASAGREAPRIEVRPGEAAEAARAVAEELRRKGADVEVRGTAVIDRATGRVVVEVGEYSVPARPSVEAGPAEPGAAGSAVPSSTAAPGARIVAPGGLRPGVKPPSEGAVSARPPGGEALLPPLPDEVSAAFLLPDGTVAVVTPSGDVYYYPPDVAPQVEEELDRRGVTIVPVLDIDTGQYTSEAPQLEVTPPGQLEAQLPEPGGVEYVPPSPPSPPPAPVVSGGGGRPSLPGGVLLPGPGAPSTRGALVTPRRLQREVVEL